MRSLKRIKCSRANILSRGLARTSTGVVPPAPTPRQADPVSTLAGNRIGFVPPRFGKPAPLATTSFPTGPRPLIKNGLTPNWLRSVISRCRRRPAPVRTRVPTRPHSVHTPFVLFQSFDSIEVTSKLASFRQLLAAPAPGPPSPAAATIGTQWGRSSVWIERSPPKRQVGSSNLPVPTTPRYAG